jgi:membrane-associated protease RseP (regulator of RpoE activity)
VAQWLNAGAAKLANVLITADGASPSEIPFPPGIDFKAVASAAAANGFQPVDHIVLPNGRQVTFWVRAPVPT